MRPGVGLIAALIAALLAGVIIFSIRTSSRQEPAAGEPTARESTNALKRPNKGFSAPDLKEPLAQPVQAGVLTTTVSPAVGVAAAAAVAGALSTEEFSTVAPETALDNMRTVIRQYAGAFGENPVGNNSEITSALAGQNPKQINFLKADDGNRVSAAGELVDRWGTPYFFHQLSAKEMEIRAAGPDRKMWTDDDLVIR